jgi:hypothetical protein
MREMMSTLPPAAKPVVSVTVRLGQASCAATKRVPNPTSPRLANKTAYAGDRMAFLPDRSWPCQHCCTIPDCREAFAAGGQAVGWVEPKAKPIIGYGLSLHRGVMKALDVVSIAWVLAGGAFALAQGTADIAPSGTLRACV